MNNLINKKVLIIICGGIAAYKSLEIIRILRKKGVDVKTILTKNALSFVTPLSVTSLSNNKVYSNMFSYENESEMDHISLSRWADIILVAPVTANTISKLSHGLADDLATTVILASNKKVFLAPAMNVRMWEHASNQQNINKLNKFGYELIGPEIGDMACGEYGQGKMTDPDAIVTHLNNFFQKKVKNLKALVTAGPTREYIDPIRFISNKSSGKQGFEIAKSLKRCGFDTTLITGPTNLDKIDDINTVKVETADEMFKKTIENLPVDVAVFSAAVGDWKPNKYFQKKLKKDEIQNLDLQKNIDIISYVSKHNSLRPRIIVGFAAETNDLINNSKKKLIEKNCDLIIANDISDKSIGFGSDYNEVTILDKFEKIETIKKKDKKLVADEVVKKLINLIN